MPTYLVSKNTHAFYAGIKIFSCLPPSMTILKSDKVKFKQPKGNTCFPFTLQTNC